MAEKRMRVNAQRRSENRDGEAVQPPEEPDPEVDPIANSGTCEYACSGGGWVLISDDANEGYFCTTYYPGDCESGEALVEDAIPDG